MKEFEDDLIKQSIFKPRKYLDTNQLTPKLHNDNYQGNYFGIKSVEFKHHNKNFSSSTNPFKTQYYNEKNSRNKLSKLEIDSMTLNSKLIPLTPAHKVKFNNERTNSFIFPIMDKNYYTSMLQKYKALNSSSKKKSSNINKNSKITTKSLLNKEKSTPSISPYIPKQLSESIISKDNDMNLFRSEKNILNILDAVDKKDSSNKQSQIVVEPEPILKNNLDDNIPAARKKSSVHFYSKSLKSGELSNIGNNANKQRKQSIKKKSPERVSIIHTDNKMIDISEKIPKPNKSSLPKISFHRIESENDFEYKPKKKRFFCCF